MSGYQTEWRAIDERRQRLMEIWYVEDGRASNPDHPMKGLYTGLYQKYGKDKCKNDPPTPST